MMRFMIFAEIQLNLSMRDIEDCLRAKPTCRAAIIHTHTGHISRVSMPWSTHSQRMSLDISLVPPKSSVSLRPGFNRVSRKAVKRI
jgi:hypothetical protein